MKSIAILFAVGLSFQSLATNEHQEGVEVSHFSGSAAVGFAAGALACAGLLIKDALCGVVIKGGPEFWGKDRILPLLVLVSASSLFTGYLGHSNSVNLLDGISVLLGIRPAPNA